MKKLPKATYKTAEELQDEIRKREVAIDLLDEGEVKQKLRVQLAQLRTYADMKRWVSAPASTDTPPN
jgi:hypothetical protein